MRPNFKYMTCCVGRGERKEPLLRFLQKFVVVCNRWDSLQWRIDFPLFFSFFLSNHAKQKFINFSFLSFWSTNSTICNKIKGQRKFYGSKKDTKEKKKERKKLKTPLSAVSLHGSNFFYFFTTIKYSTGNKLRNQGQTGNKKKWNTWFSPGLLPHIEWEADKVPPN